MERLIGVLVGAGVYEVPGKIHPPPTPHATRLSPPSLLRRWTQFLALSSINNRMDDKKPRPFMEDLSWALSHFHLLIPLDGIHVDIKNPNGSFFPQGAIVCPVLAGCQDGRNRAEEASLGLEGYCILVLIVLADVLHRVLPPVVLHVHGECGGSMVEAENKAWCAS